MTSVNRDYMGPDLEANVGPDLEAGMIRVNEPADEPADDEPADRDVIEEVKTFLKGLIDSLTGVKAGSNRAGSKRKYSHAFVTDYGVDTFDDARYGQHIGQTFFAANFGHGVYMTERWSTFAERNPLYRADTVEGSEFYRTNRNLFNV